MCEHLSSNLNSDLTRTFQIYQPSSRTYSKSADYLSIWTTNLAVYGQLAPGSCVIIRVTNQKIFKSYNNVGLLVIFFSRFQIHEANIRKMLIMYLCFWMTGSECLLNLVNTYHKPNLLPNKCCLFSQAIVIYQLIKSVAGVHKTKCKPQT